jgi:hypothetical protein
MTATDFPWDDSRLVAPATVHHLSIGGRSILFCEARQVLYGLNSTADCIWQSLADGRPPLAARRQLAELGVAADDARVFVEDATISWLNGGQLAPLEALARLDQPASTTRNYLIDDLSVRMDFFGGVSANSVDEVFGQFAADARPSALRLSIVSCRDRFFLFEAGRPLGSHDADEWIPRLKAILTEHYTARARNAFLVHAAFLVRHGKGILISGAPGAGKTTLTVALSRSGFEYHGDDIVRVESNGKAVGTPFAACVKSGAWPLVEPYVPDIASLPIYRRPDAKDARYLKMPLAERHPRSIDFVLLLSRKAGAAPAFEPVEPLDAFSLLLESAFSSKGAIAAPALKTFASAIDSAASFRFVYSSLPDAVKAVEDLTSE